MTDSEFDLHIRNPANAQYLTTLLVCEHSTGVVRFSDKGFSPFDTNTPFHSFLLKDQLPIIEYALDANVALGDFTVINNVDPDLYGNLEFAGHTCELYLGDKRWVHSSDDFRQVGKAIIGSVDDQGNGKYTFNLTDYGYKLDEPVQSNKDTDGQSKLLIYGSVFNVKPQVVDPLTLTFRFHDGDATGYALTVKDRGLDVTANVVINHAAGTFYFTSGNNPTGVDNVRIDVVGTETTAEAIIQAIATRNGLGAVTTVGFDTLQDTAVHGVPIRSDESMNAVFESIMLSIGGYHTLDNFGAIKLIYADLTGTEKYKITGDESTKPIKSSTIPALSKAVIKYNRNQDPQSSDQLASSLTEPQKQVFIDEYSVIEKTVTSSTGFLDEIKEYETTLVNQADAQALADNRAIWRGVARKIYSLKINMISDRCEIGDILQISQSSFNEKALLVGISKKSGQQYNECEVMI